MMAGTMRVAYFVNQYPKVSHSFIRREILALERRGLDVHRFALRGWDADLVDEDDLRELARTRHLLRRGLIGLLAPSLRLLVATPARFIRGMALAVRVARGGDRSLAHHIVTCLEAAQLVLWMREQGIRHVHAHFGTNSAEVAMLAKALADITYSFTIHGPDEWDMPQQHKLGEKVAAAEFTVAISSYTRAQLTRWCEPRDWERIQIVRCGVDPKFLQALPTAVPDVDQVVCVGRLSRQKSQLLLIEAVAQLRRQGVGIQVVLAGDGELRGEIEAAIDRHQLQAHVRITGWVSAEEVKRLMLQSRGVVLASAMEGLPVVLMEAMALQRPVVATWIAGIPELVVPREHGWLVPAGSVEALARAMGELLATPVEALQAMGERGRRAVATQHDVDAEAGRLLTLLQGSTRSDVLAQGR
jgi:colanic acid/amylovoran biosynthesis glycosyltransferase